MIGVICGKHDEEIAKELFELFKTPWEFYQEGRDYDVVLCSDQSRNISEIDARLIVIYSSEKTQFDSANQIKIEPGVKRAMLKYKKISFPVYGNVSTFREKENPLIMTRESNEVAGIEINSGNKKIIRLYASDLICFMKSFFYFQKVSQKRMPTSQLWRFTSQCYGTGSWQLEYQ